MVNQRLVNRQFSILFYRREIFHRVFFYRKGNIPDRLSNENESMKNQKEYTLQFLPRQQRKVFHLFGNVLHYNEKMHNNFLSGAKGPWSKGANAENGDEENRRAKKADNLSTNGWKTCSNLQKLELNHNTIFTSMEFIMDLDGTENDITQHTTQPGSSISLYVFLQENI